MRRILLPVWRRATPALVNGSYNPVTSSSPLPPPLTVTLGSKGRYVSAWVEKCGIHSDEDGQGCRAAAGPMTQCSAQGTAGHATAFLV